MKKLILLAALIALAWGAVVVSRGRAVARRHPIGTGPAELPVAQPMGSSSDFAFTSFRTAAIDSTSNAIYSPLSVKEAFAMLDLGAKGETHAEIARVMADGEGREAFAAKTAAVGRAVRKSNQEGSKLRVADGIWVQDGFELRQPYLRAVDENFGAPIKILDFGANPKAAVDEINAWVSLQTEAMIPSILDESIFHRRDPVQLILVNAIYMDAKWLNPFDPELTEKKDFHPLEGPSKKAEMMFREGMMAYAETAQDQILRLNSSSTRPFI